MIKKRKAVVIDILKNTTNRWLALLDVIGEGHLLIEVIPTVKICDVVYVSSASVEKAKIETDQMEVNNILMGKWKREN